MACGACRKNRQSSPSNTRGTVTQNDLEKFAFLTPKQLRLLEQQGKKPGEGK
jgi:hypothetical protein